MLGKFGRPYREELIEMYLNLGQQFRYHFNP